MHNKRGVAVFVASGLLLLAGVSGRAHAQLLNPLEPALHLRTDSFDIYAPLRLESEAFQLSSFADQTYATLCEFFGVRVSGKRIPVLLSDLQYALNGYATLYPSNRIIILLASADPRGQLATMQDELYSVFLHELVHYVTLNERTRGWRAVAWLLGDWVAPEVWMMPEAAVEGTAVWAESRLGRDGVFTGATAGIGDRVEGSAQDPWGRPSGRLNNPAALEIVKEERLWGKERSLWEVSGLTDFYGAGSLPYLYGGLFIDFLSEQYGVDTIVRLWQLSADGNIFRGFDGTLTSGGVLERETGVEPQQLWREFLMWLDASGVQSSKGEAAHGEADLDGAEEVRTLVSGYIGAVGYGEGVLYFVDLERRGLYALSLRDIVGGAAGGEARDMATLRPERLFAVDENVRNIFFNVKFGSLDLDWIRIDAGNRQIPARYRYDIMRHRLSYEYDLPIPAPGNALAGFEHNSKKEPFLYDPWEDPETSIRYGLARIGTAVLPARQLPQGRLEVAGIPDSVIRWLSPGYRDHGESIDSVRFALSTIQDNGLSRLAVLEEKDGAWQLAVAKKASSQGSHQPIFVDTDHIVCRTANKDGQTSLLLHDISDQLSPPIKVSWLSPTEWIARYVPESSVGGAEHRSIHTQTAPNTASRLRPALFPELFSTSRVPYADSSRVGLSFVASDLSERLAWTAFGGWDFLTQRPVLDAEARLNLGAWRVNVYAADQGMLASPVARRSSLGCKWVWTHTLLPSFRNFSVDLRAAFAGVQNNYAADGFFDMAPDYYTWVAGLGLQFSSAYGSHRPPYDPLGVELSGAVEYEAASETGFGGVSLSASARLRGRLSVVGYGTVAPAGGVAFAPAMRYLESGGTSILSAADLPYPEYREYRNLVKPSAWYVFGETQYRLFSFEAGRGWILRLPFLPSVALRRVIGNLGLRGAGLDIDGKPSLLSSAFAAVDFDCALLAGLVAETHSHVMLEAAWAFQSSATKSAPLCLTIGFRASF